ncbi:hypothetical protein LAJ19_21555 (plasmid) [Deinococcus taeanensis]|uniref:hypothetical protein n=1 Tax=Deinococcus taeanensis TaxID=2737050 RepID=UPI001CDC5038|nr:hypothetical protein [Deinococcus taeanensis]UBV45513.1 hypothetical protein LAJ19_21555 [Deinococcus taeanensis]
MIAMERYKTRPGRPNGPFRPDLITDLGDARQLGSDFERFAPKRVRALYAGQVPSRFYRLRYLELWSFGRLKVNQVRDPVEGAQAYGKRNADGSVRLKLLREAPNTEKHRELTQDDWRIISPESTSYPLGFSAARPEGAPSHEVKLPPLFGRLIPHLQYFWGGHEGLQSRLNIWEIQYGAESTIVMHKVNPQDTKAERGMNTVTYASEHDGLPLLYGYDMRTEGLRVPYDREVLDRLTATLTQRLLADEARGAHLQDQFLRYLLKCEPWTADVEGGLNAFTQRLMADVLCTMRAESRAHGQSGRDFLPALRDPAGWAQLLGWAKLYWADHRMLNDEFTEQAALTLADDVAFTRLQKLFARVQNSQKVREYVSDTLVHSLKHAARNMFTMHGSADSHLVGSSAQLSVTHGHNAHEAAFYIYERNQDGAGSTRSASRFLTAKPGLSLTGRLVEEWWRYTLECPVAEDEQLIKAVIGPDAQGRAEVIQEVRRILSCPPHERQQGLAQLQHVLQRATQFTLELSSPQTGRLAAQLLAEVHVLGETFNQLELLLELLELERSLCQRFRRLPLPAEVAGYALQQVKLGEGVPELSRLYTVYERQFAQHVGDDDDESANATDRFLAQVEALSVSTCVDACPACLASSCDLGHIDVMRHNVSRTLLKRAHELLTADFTVTGTHLQAEELLEQAALNGGFVIHEHVGHLDSSVMRRLRAAGFEQHGRIFDPEHLKIRTILYREDQA